MNIRNLLLTAFSVLAITANASDTYTPTPEIRQAQKEFADRRFGIFLHWGIYSMMGQGEWYLNYGPNAQEYAKAASGFYPSKFNAHDWVKAIKDSGAKYFPAQTWGTSTRKGDRLFVHILKPESKHVFVPTSAKVKSAKEFATGKKVKYTKASDGILIELDELPTGIDHIIELDAPLQ